MPTIPVNVINHAEPAIEVTVADSGVPSITYSQLRQSLGRHIYKVNQIYIYSENKNQILGVIQYQIFDANGDQKYSSIPVTIDPYNGLDVATVVDFSNYVNDIILNGNSSFAADILPNTFVQVKFYTERVTNSFGMNLDNFKAIEIAANKPNFYDLTYGDSIEHIQESNEAIAQTATLKPKLTASGSALKPKLTASNDFVPMAMLGIAAISIGIYLSKQK